MNTINFDTLKAAKSLQDAGFETRQAEAVVGMVTYALSEGLATREDVRDLKSSIEVDVRDLKSSIEVDVRDLKSSIAALDVKIDNGLAALDSKIDRSVAALNVKIDNGLNNVIQKLTILLGGIVIGSFTLLGVLSRVFPVLPAP